MKFARLREIVQYITESFSDDDFKRIAKRQAEIAAERARSGAPRYAESDDSSYQPPSPAFPFLGGKEKKSSVGFGKANIKWVPSGYEEPDMSHPSHDYFYASHYANRPEKIVTGLPLSNDANLRSSPVDLVPLDHYKAVYGPDSAMAAMKDPEAWHDEGHPLVTHIIKFDPESISYPYLKHEYQTSRVGGSQDRTQCATVVTTFLQGVVGEGHTNEDRFRAALRKRGIEYVGCHVIGPGGQGTSRKVHPSLLAGK